MNLSSSQAPVVSQPNAGPGGALVPWANPSSVPATPIAADTLGQTPSSPINLPPTTPYTPPVNNVPAPTGTTVGDNGMATVPPPTTQSASSQIQSLINQEGTEGTVQSNLETAAGTDKLQAQQTADFNAYTQAKLDQTNTIASMKENIDRYGSTAQLNEAITNYQAKSDATISNLAVQSQISSGNYTNAEDTITKKLDAQFNPIKDMISALGSLASTENTENTTANNDMTDSEKEEATTKAAQLTKDSGDVHDAALSIQTTVAKNGSYQQVAPKIDSILADYTNGKITAAQAQSQMFAAASPYMQTAAGGLTASETSTGAVKAGVDEKTFSSLPADVQAFYARGSEAQLTAAENATDADSINALQVTPAVKQYLISQLPTDTSSSGGGFLSSIGNFFSNLFGGGSNGTGGSDTSTTTLMTGPDGIQYQVPNDKVAGFKAAGGK